MYHPSSSESPFKRKESYQIKLQNPSLKIFDLHLISIIGEPVAPNLRDLHREIYSLEESHKPSMDQRSRGCYTGMGWDWLGYGHGWYSDGVKTRIGNTNFKHVIIFPNFTSTQSFSCFSSRWEEKDTAGDSWPLDWNLKHQTRCSKEKSRCVAFGGNT